MMNTKRTIFVLFFFLARDLFGSSVSWEIKLFHSSSYPSHLVQYIHTINIFLNEFIEWIPTKKLEVIEKDNGYIEKHTWRGVAAIKFKIYMHSEKITKPFRRELENSGD